jgi:vesicle coat complex subunit
MALARSILDDIPRSSGGRWPQVLLELKEYATEVDVEFVRKAVRAIGRCAIGLERATEACINVLLELIQTKVRLSSSQDLHPPWVARTWAPLHFVTTCVTTADLCFRCVVRFFQKSFLVRLSAHVFWRCTGELRGAGVHRGDQGHFPAIPEPL